jgi:hypothetical protein
MLDGDYKVRYKNAKGSNEKIELDGKSFIHCEFESCLILLEKGETEISGCSFKNCKLMLKGNAYTVGRIITFFTGKSPLKVLDMGEPVFERGEQSYQKSMNDKRQEFAPANRNGSHSKFRRTSGVSSDIVLRIHEKENEGL